MDYKLNSSLGICILFCSFINSAFGQQNGSIREEAKGFVSILSLGSEDATKVLKAFIEPATEGLTYAINGGWYHSARVQKPFKFKITLGSNFSKASQANQSFNFSELGLESNIMVSKDDTPTLIGNGETAKVTVNIPDKNQTITFNMPNGVAGSLPFSRAPGPIVQATFGIPSGSDIIFRVIPRIGNDELKFRLLGIGAKHNISQYFQENNNSNPLQYSVVFGFTNLNVDYNLTSNDKIENANQINKFVLNALTLHGVVSYDTDKFTFYGGGGYSGGNTEERILGEYEIMYNILNPDIPDNEQVQSVVDPILFKDNFGSIFAKAGISWNLGFINIFGDYTFQNYETFSIGISINLN